MPDGSSAGLARYAASGAEALDRQTVDDHAKNNPADGLSPGL